MSASNPGGGPLEGIRILDFTIVMSGPMCTRSFADAGAEVIKIESHEGDMPRTRPPFRAGISTYWGSMNCGKHSVVLDLQTADGKRIARELARTADVVVENFRPGVMKRLGLDYPTLSAENPRLIYCSISGFGQEGPGASVAAYAPVIRAASGYELAHASYQDDPEKPAASGIFIADVLGAIHAVSAVNLALFDRERSGSGQFIDVAMMDAVIGMLVGEVQDAQFPGERLPAPYRPIRASDGYVMIAVATPRNFDVLFSIIGLPPGYDSVQKLRDQAKGWNWVVIFPHMEAWASSRTAAEVEEKLSACGVPCSRYRTLEQALADPQSLHREITLRVGKGAGSFAVANPPYRLSRAEVFARQKLPKLGEDTDSVLEQALGYTRDELFRLRQAGVIGGQPSSRELQPADGE